MRYLYLLSAASIALALPAVAPAAVAATPNDTPSDAANAAPADEQSLATNPANDIVVTGLLQQSEKDVLSGTTILTGEELTRQLRPSIGETLARQPGVSATSFGPSASRPILRGFQGERVRVLTDGIGSIDVSNTSVDH